MNDTSVYRKIEVNRVSSRALYVRAGINSVGFFSGNITMKKIQLTQGKVAFVDNEDYERLNQWKWCASKCRNNFYAQRSIYLGSGRKYRHIKMHRLILKPKDGEGIDHRDRNGLNNTKNNLRTCTESQNGANQRPQKGRSSNYKGVCWNKNKKKWQAQIQARKKHIYLGLYNDETEAAKAYNKAAIKLFGEFAYLNIFGN